MLETFAGGLPDVPEFVHSLGASTEPGDIEAFGGMLPSWPHFPGARHVSYRQFAPAPGERPGPGLWRVLEAAVREREIPVGFETPAVDLIHDGDRVTGAIVESAGERRAIAARGGVILGSGSFEADPELRDTYLPLPLVSVGHQANTGDTLRLARAAGASLWHMSAFFGWLSFVHPAYPAGFTLDVHAPSFIYVDGDGLRFADETGWEVHDRLRALTAYLPRRRNRPRMPGWIVFDEAARLAGPLHGIVGSPNGYAWSPDNSAEIDAGWIKRGRRPAELVVGAPVPGLFAAGAAGSIWGHLTEHGGGLTDAIVFGRIAGARAAAAVEEPEPEPATTR